MALGTVLPHERDVKNGVSHETKKHICVAISVRAPQHLERFTLVFFSFNFFFAFFPLVETSAQSAAQCAWKTKFKFHCSHTSNIFDKCQQHRIIVIIIIICDYHLLPRSGHLHRRRIETIAMRMNGAHGTNAIETRKLYCVEKRSILILSIHLILCIPPHNFVRDKWTSSSVPRPSPVVVVFGVLCFRCDACILQRGSFRKLCIAIGYTIRSN